MSINEYDKLFREQIDMIHFIKGQYAGNFNGGVVIEAAGLGYEVFVPDNSPAYLLSDGDLAKLYTKMIVREDDISLYGFSQKEGLELFEKLITVNGVGAKAALSIMSAMSINDIRSAIAFEDTAMLTKANGIGKKTAQRIVLELKDKMSDFSTTGALNAMDLKYNPAEFTDDRTEAMNALISLGYTKAEAVNALSKVTENDLSCEEYIKKALSRLY